jgi:hypothetical protein
MNAPNYLIELCARLICFKQQKSHQRLDFLSLSSPVTVSKTRFEFGHDYIDTVLEGLKNSGYSNIPF